MTTMRLPAILAAVLVAAGGLAGCFGSDGDEAKPAAVGGDNKNGLPNVGIGPGGEPLTVLSALKTTIKADAPAWVESGTAVSLTAAVNSDKMVEPVKYTWATGALPGTIDVEAPALDTGSSSADEYLQTDESGSITFTGAGNFLMHCHPHPDMLQNVTVIEGYTGPSEVEAFIVDGAKLNEYRFVPERLVIGAGTTVTYTNLGQQPHTATIMSAEPPLKATGAAEATAQVVVEGDGWQRIVVIAEDAEGRIGYAEYAIYVTPELPSFPTKTETFTFNVGGAPNEVEAAKTTQFTLAHAGKLFLNWTGTDAASASGETLAEFELHLVKQGEKQDTLTGDSATSRELVTTAPDGVYTLSVKATSGVQPEATVTIEVIYDLVPPAPATSAADDGHGGHQH